jgi:hypothetical protein
MACSRGPLTSATTSTVATAVLADDADVPEVGVDADVVLPDQRLSDDAVDVTALPVGNDGRASTSKTGNVSAS